MFVSYQSTGIKRPVTSIVDDGNKSLIIGTDNGIAIYERTKHIVNWLQNNPTNNLNSLLSNNVSTLYKDRSGVIWIGTSNGVCKLSEKGNIYLFKIYREMNTPNPIIQSSLCKPIAIETEYG